MAPSQNATCWRPSLAAIPTHVEPTTQSTCAITRSRNASSLRRPGWSFTGTAGTETAGMADYDATGFGWMGEAGSYWKLDLSMISGTTVLNAESPKQE